MQTQGETHTAYLSAGHGAEFAPPITDELAQLLEAYEAMEEAELLMWLTEPEDESDPDSGNVAFFSDLHELTRRERVALACGVSELVRAIDLMQRAEGGQ